MPKHPFVWRRRSSHEWPALWLADISRYSERQSAITENEMLHEVIPIALISLILYGRSQVVRCALNTLEDDSNHVVDRRCPTARSPPQDDVRAGLGPR